MQRIAFARRRYARGVGTMCDRPRLAGRVSLTRTSAANATTDAKHRPGNCRTISRAYDANRHGHEEARKNAAATDRGFPGNRVSHTDGTGVPEARGEERDARQRAR